LKPHPEARDVGFGNGFQAGTGLDLQLDLGDGRYLLFDIQFWGFSVKSRLAAVSRSECPGVYVFFCNGIGDKDYFATLFLFGEDRRFDVAVCVVGRVRVQYLGYGGDDVNGFAALEWAFLRNSRESNGCLPAAYAFYFCILQAVVAFYGSVFINYGPLMTFFTLCGIVGQRIGGRFIGLQCLFSLNEALGASLQKYGTQEYH